MNRIGCNVFKNVLASQKQASHWGLDMKLDYDYNFSCNFSLLGLYLKAQNELTLLPM